MTAFYEIFEKNKNKREPDLDLARAQTKLEYK